MGFPAGPFYIDDTYTFTVLTTDAATGALTDADSVPSYRVYEDETGAAILNGNMAKLDDGNTTGFYSEQLTLSVANGFEVGKSYNIYVAATIDSVVGGTTGGFKVIAAPHSAADVWAVGTRSLTILDEDSTTLDLDATIRSAVGLASANLDTQLSEIDNFIDTEVSAIKAKTDQLTFGVANTLNVNVTYVNEVEVDGAGTEANPWGPV